MSAHTTTPKSPDTAFPQGSNLGKLTRETIRRIPLLSEISEEEVALVLRELRITQYPRRETIIQKGSAPDSLLFLIAGQLQVIDVTENGREVGLRILSPGEFFGEIAVINGCPRTAFVVALTNVIVAFLPRTTALHLFSHSPSIANKMMGMLANKIQKDSEFRALLSIQNSSKRVCTLTSTMRSWRSTTCGSPLTSSMCGCDRTALETRCRCWSRAAIGSGAWTSRSAPRRYPLGVCRLPALRRSRTS